MVTFFPVAYWDKTQSIVVAETPKVLDVIDWKSWDMIGWYFKQEVVKKDWL